MIPSVISTQVRQGIEDFLRTTFPPAEPFFENVLESLIAEQNALFKGPFVTLKLPFRPGKMSGGHFADIPMKFAPYRHQERAYERLSGDRPQSTLIATGTGSGKTECFLYPLLDYCYRHRGERGVKAIIIYPMNALATDQARRFAREISSNAALNGNVTAGLFIGGLDKNEGQKGMSEEMVITDAESMRNYPPDILMTNYKMLDYLLLRPRDYRLWNDNRPDTLKFVVIDELHTFDGAQGTDLACLLRRLLDRLKTPRKESCFIGTSATLGDGDESVQDLLEFTSTLFGAPLDASAIIREDLLKPGEFLGDQTLIKYHQSPNEAQLDQLLSVNYGVVDDYIRAQCALWFNGWRVERELDDPFKIDLGRRLREHLFFQNFIRLLNGMTLDFDGIMAQLDRFHAGFSEQTNLFRTALVDSILSLVAVARTVVVSNEGNETVRPFLQLRTQLWLKELRRMAVSVEPEPRLRFSDDLLSEEGVEHLPVLHCRSCGRMGWLSTKSEGEHRLNASLDKIYAAFFGHSPAIHYIFHEDREQLQPGQQVETRETLCGSCLAISHGEKITACLDCGRSDCLVPVRCFNPRRQSKAGKWYVDSSCPHCGEHDGMMILGSRSASLISVAISQLFASAFNHDRKLLAFSDSVQDASHRAGFFGGRTYRFNLRTAIQQVVESSERAYTVSELPSAFMAYWLEKLGSPSRFAAQFIAPDMQWHEEYEQLEKSDLLPDEGELFGLIEQRIRWDILYEYGHGSRVGRTLEKTGCSIARLRTDALDDWAQCVCQRLREEIGSLRHVELLEVKQFLIGMVKLCRTRGGIYADFLNAYLEGTGNAYVLKRLPFMPNSNRTPAFIYDGAGSASRLDPLIGSGTSLTTYQKWLARCFGSSLPYGREIYRVVLSEALSRKIFVAVQAKQGTVYGLNPDLLEIEKSVDQYVCSRTRYSTSVARSEHAICEGMPSERFDAAGVLRRKEVETDYYGALYRHGQVARVVPKEHTGLLERKDREDLERSFMQGQGAPAPNILSCTPTLEMGINIGDLSTVILCSVPPTQANYIQRIGRAGRRDGNAFNLVVATGRPHDLHFFAEPVNMISGHVQSPGIFLNAPAVLERQLTAFCFDRWMQAVKGKETVIPLKLNAVLNQIDKDKDASRFPYNLMDYIELNRTVILHDFIALFGGVLTDDSVNHLEGFIRGGTHRDGSLDHCIINRLHELKAERKGLTDRLKRIRKRIKDNEENPARDQMLNDALDELKMEKSALNRLVRLLNDKHTFNFFTDEGLLPNYAFPEAGVSLRSVIYRKKAKVDGKGKYDTWTHEYERPAVAAIQELAPGNAFYVDGRKLMIDQIDLSVSPREIWRFCGECSHAELNLPEAPQAACPKCGSRTWADAAMVRPLIKMKQVVATQSDRDSRSHDDSDDRDPIFYNKHMLTEVDPCYIEQAYRIQDESLPFGFEFVRKALFREVNFGKQDFFDGDEIEIAGNKVSRQGFQLCEKCGKVLPDKEKDREHFRHAIDCAHYGKGSEKGIIDCLYLYRLFESEAIRILLPVAEVDLSFKLPSFIAALYMGLSEKFRGSVAHLQVMVTDEPVPDTTLRKKYLVLYDQVPGGTGYLKELMKKPEDIMELLQLAFDKLKGCACQVDENKDGCYQCLYAYRVSRDLPDISRKEAMDLLDEILRHKHRLERIKTVGDIGINALFESELEKRFIEALRRSSTNDRKVALRSEVVNGKPGYFMLVNEIGYRIEPQVEIADKEGIAVPSRADFMIRPVRGVQEGQLPIAIFTDGFAYHADPAGDHYRLPKDLEQRMSLMKSGRYLCWSLSYEDVMSKFDDSITEYWDPFHAGNVDSLLRAYEKNHAIRPIKSALRKGAMEGLVMWLAQPDYSAWTMLASLYAISFSHRGFSSPETLCSARDRLLRLEVDYRDLISGLQQSNDTSEFWCGQLTLDKKDQLRACALISSSAEMIKANNFSTVDLLVRFEDADVAVDAAVFKRSWNGLLQMMNLVQFLPNVAVVSSRFIAEGYSVPQRIGVELVTRQDSDLSPEIMAAYRLLTGLVLEDALPVLSMAMELRLAPPNAGFELCDQDERVLGMAELVWQELKIALLLDDEALKPFEDNGWRVNYLSQIKSKDVLMKLFA
jgi:DEAD/DEAH box helicase domain-containing protein